MLLACPDFWLRCSLVTLMNQMILMLSLTLIQNSPSIVSKRLTVSYFTELSGKFKSAY